MNNLSTNNSVLTARAISKTFDDAGKKLTVLHSIDLSVSAGESIAIVGASGSGKSTLLHILGGLDLPTSGTVEFLGKDLARSNETERGYIRNQSIGFVYQFHHLLPEFSALENVAMPLLLATTLPESQRLNTALSIPQIQETAAQMLHKVGLGHRLTHKPGMLSGGERQRVALARALVHNPKLLLADEPTGNLDRATADQMYQLLETLRQSMGLSVILVTHDERLAGQASRVLRMQDGAWL